MSLRKCGKCKHIDETTKTLMKCEKMIKKSKSLEKKENKL